MKIPGLSLRSRPVLAAFLCTAYPLSAALAQQPSEKQVVDGILGRSPGVDVNKDKTIDVRDLVVFLNNQPIEVFFESSSSVARDWAGEHKIVGRLAKKATGKIRIVLSGSGDADASKIGSPVSGSGEREISINNSDRFEIPVPIVPSDRLPLARSVIVSLGIPKNEEGLLLPDPAETDTPKFSAHEIRIVSHEAGLYSGTISFPAQVSTNPKDPKVPVFSPIAPIPPISLRFARRKGETSILLEPNPFLPEQLVVKHAGNWPSGTQASGTKEIKELNPKRTVSWTIAFGEFKGGSESEPPQAPVTITLRGLAFSTERTLEVRGVLVLALAEPVQTPAPIAKK